MEPFVGPSGEFLEHVAEVSEGFHAIELASLDEGVEGGRSFAPGIVPGKEEVFAADGNPPQRPLHGIVMCALLRHGCSVGSQSDPANSRSSRKHLERSRR